MITVFVPFKNVLELVYLSQGNPTIVLQEPVKAWLDLHDHQPRWIMNNPWEAYFEYEDPQQAMLFKLVWS